MYRAFYQGLTFTWLPQATMVFFCTVFAVVLLRLFVFRRKPDFDPIAAMPLNDEETKR